jgi:serine protease Do
MPDSVAAKAGIKAGDVVIGIEGDTVHTASDVSSRVGMAKPGDRLKLVLWRDKARQDITVSLGKAESAKAEAVAKGSDTASLGLSVRPLEPAEMQRAELDHGLLVEQVSGPAQLAGVEPGDVLLALNGQPVQGVAQVREALRSHPKRVALLIKRGGQQIFVPVELG